MNRKHLWGNLEKTLFIPVLSILSGLIIAGIVLIIVKKDPFSAIEAIFHAGFSCNNVTNCNLFQTLQLATPLILTGLSAVVAFRAGMFSIGQEGQLVMGALIAAWLGYSVHIPKILHPVFILLMAMVAGGLYAALPGILKVTLNVNEVIITIILNKIAVLFMNYMINFPLRADKGTTAHSPLIDKTAYLQPFFQGSKWGIGFVIAVFFVWLVHQYLWKSTFGYEHRMTGQAPFFAQYAGIKNKSVALRAMILSGALAGLAGGIEVLGVHHRLMQGFSTGQGFDGVMVAILGQVQPIGVLIVAILFAGMRFGAQIGLQISMNIPRELGGIIIACIILFVSGDNFFKSSLEKTRKFIHARITGRKRKGWKN